MLIFIILAIGIIITVLINIFTNENELTLPKIILFSCVTFLIACPITLTLLTTKDNYYPTTIAPLSQELEQISVVGSSSITGSTQYSITTRDKQIKILNGRNTYVNIVPESEDENITVYEISYYPWLFRKEQKYVINVRQYHFINRVD